MSLCISEPDVFLFANYLFVVFVYNGGFYTNFTAWFQQVTKTSEADRTNDHANVQVSAHPSEKDKTLVRCFNHLMRSENGSPITNKITF
jgi:hypothetical protein